MKRLCYTLIRSPLFVVAVYALFGVLWIKYSDQFLLSMTADLSLLSTLQTWKGLFYIAVTSVLLAILVYHNIHLNIRYEQEQIQQFLDTPIPLIVLHESGTVEQVNQAFTDLLGYSREEIGSTALWFERAYPDPDYRAWVMNQWIEFERVLRLEKTASIDRVFQVTGKRGTVHTIRFFVIRERHRTLILLNDLTREKQMERELRQADKLNVLGQLAGGIIHDFNNQLATISSAAGVVELSESLDSDARESLGYIHDAVTTAKELTSQLLLFSRREELVMAPLNLTALVADSVTIISRTFGRTISVHAELPTEAVIVQGVDSLLKNGLLNLAINARDAMEGVGKLTISLAAVDQTVQLRIADTGSGIPESILSHLFEPFYTTKEAGRGTGLGLASVKETIVRHNGTIEVESTGSSGTVLLISLPVLSTEMYSPTETS